MFKNKKKLEKTSNFEKKSIIENQLDDALREKLMEQLPFLEEEQGYVDERDEYYNFIEQILLFVQSEISNNSSTDLFRILNIDIVNFSSSLQNYLTEFFRKNSILYPLKGGIKIDLDFANGEISSFFRSRIFYCEGDLNVLKEALISELMLLDRYSKSKKAANEELNLILSRKRQ